MRQFASQSILRPRSSIGRTLYASRASTHFLWRVHHPSARFFSSTSIPPGNNSYRRWPWGLFFLVVAALGYSLITPQSIAADEVNDEEKIEAYLAQGKKYLEAGDIESAKNCFDRIWEIRSDDAALYFRITNLCYKWELFDYALELLSHVIVLDPKNFTAYNNRGILLSNLNRVEEALSDYTQAIALNANYSSAYHNRANLFGKLNRIEEALSDYAQAIALSPRDATLYYNRAISLEKVGRIEEAVADYTQVITLDPKNIVAYYNRGYLLTDLDRIEEALSDYTQVITLDPKNAAAYLNRGILLSDLGRVEEALSDYIRAIELNPKDPKGYYNRANSLRELNRAKEALSDYTQAIILNAKYAAAYGNRGILLNDLGRVEEALVDCTQAIILDPKNARVYYNRANVLSDSGRNDEAISDYTKVIALDSKYVAAYRNRGVLFCKIGRQDEALADFAQAIVLDPKNAFVYNNRALLFRDCERYDEAIYDFEKAFDLIKDNPNIKVYRRIIENYASTLLLIGEFSSAEEIMKYLSEPLTEDLMAFKERMYDQYGVMARKSIQEYSKEELVTMLCDAAAQGTISIIEKAKPCLNEHNQDGKTALVVAVENKQRDFIRALLDAGVDVNISALPKIDDGTEASTLYKFRGLPIDVACSQSKDWPICEMLLRHRQKTDIEKVERAIEACVPKSEEDSKKLEHKIIYHFNQFIGSYDINKSCYNKIFLERYNKGLYGKIEGDLDYHDVGKSKKIKAVETFKEDFFLKIHLFFLFEMLALMRSNSFDVTKKVDLPFAYTGNNQQKIYDFLQKEFLLCLEMYKAFDDNQRVHVEFRDKKSDKNFKLLSGAHADNILEKVHSLELGETYSYPSGYRGYDGWFSQYVGHTVYVSFFKAQQNTKREESVQVRIDNVGLGSEKHVDGESQRDVGNRAPDCLISPCLLMMTQNSMNLHQYILNTTQARFDGDSEKALRHIYPLPCERCEDWPLQDQQLIDNCVAANYLVGLYIRLYELQKTLEHGEKSEDASKKLLAWMKGNLRGRACHYQEKSAPGKEILESYWSEPQRAHLVEFKN